jgi:ABC-type spermidine/putrescine transport system permease subunit II
MSVASTARDAGGGPDESERQRTDVKKERRDWRQYVGFVPAAVLFGVFFIAPLCLIVVYSFWITKNYELVPAFTKNNYATIITTSMYVKTFGKTVLMAFLATFDRAGIGVPVLLLAGALRSQKTAAGGPSSCGPTVLDQLSAAGLRMGGDFG